MARLYAQVTGVTLIILGLVGIITGDVLLSLNSELVEDIVHLLAGAVALYAGFGTRSDGPAIQYARIFGAVYLLLGILGFVIPRLFGLLPDVGYRIQDNIVHLVLGAIGLYIGFAADRSSARM
ncbi:MAG: DUF4383 domain-containing protein [Chloroflexota bacterium]|nr:DUF4383 domain-containing protein [Chloroflexota bacterium]